MSDSAAPSSPKGALKAAAAAFRAEVLALALPGVATWRSTNVIERLQALGIDEVVIANDADAITNVSVARPTLDLAEALLLSGRKVTIARWDPVVAKGIDDLLLLTPYQPEHVNLRDWLSGLPPLIRSGLTVHRGPFDVPPEAMPPPEPPRPVLPLDDARCVLRAEVGRLLERPARREFHIFADPPGVGKTVAVVDHLVAMRHAGRWPTVTTWGQRGHPPRVEPMRLFVAFPNKTLLREVLADHPALTTFAMVQEGRSADPASPWHCRLFEQQRALGSRRHSVMLELCGTCPYQDGCGYLASLGRAHQADVVLATHATILTQADELGAGRRPWETGRRRAHTVVVDEDFAGGLVEEVALDAGILDEWRARCPGVDPATSLLDVVEHALAEATAEPGADPVPALPILRAVAAARGRDLDAIVADLDAIREAGSRPYRWPFERPRWEPGERGQRRFVVPLRLFADLLRTLREELRAGRPVRTTRLWLGRRTGEDGRRRAVLLVQLPLRAVIRRLRAATVLHLNGTPNRPLLDLVFPRAEYHEHEVAAAQVVTQVDTALYTPAHLGARGGRALAVLQALIDAVAARHGRTGVFCRKAFAPGAGTPGPVRRFRPSPGGAVAFGTFGGHTRGLNVYAGVDALVVAGHHQIAPFDAERQVQALRWMRRSADAPAESPFSLARVYRFRRADGSGRARVVHGHRDPVVQAVLDESTSAEIAQAIGRARACHRPADRPVHVYVLTAAVTNLPIDRLVGAGRLLTELSATADPPIPAADPLGAANARREAEAAGRVRSAIGALQSRAVPLTVSGIARAAQADRPTVRRVLAAARQEIGGGGADCLRDLYAHGPTTPHFSAGRFGPEEPETGVDGQSPESASPGGARPAATGCRLGPVGGGPPIRWAAAPGWIQIQDPSDGQWHELPVRECPPWVWRAALATRRHFAA